MAILPFGPQRPQQAQSAAAQTQPALQGLIGNSQHPLLELQAELHRQRMDALRNGGRNAVTMQDITAEPYHKFIEQGVNRPNAPSYQRELDARQNRQIKIDDMEVARGQKMLDAEQELHPVFQDLHERAARRAAYPAEAAAQGNIAAAGVGAQGRYDAADLSYQGRQASAQATIMSAIINGLKEAMQPYAGDEKDPQAKQRRIAELMAAIRGLQLPGFGASDDDPDY